MFGDEDLIAMKINAILGRGRKKDFWDIYELVYHYSLSNIIGLLSQKISNANAINFYTRSPYIFHGYRRKRRTGQPKGANLGGC